MFNNLLDVLFLKNLLSEEFQFFNSCTLEQQKMVDQI